MVHVLVDILIAIVVVPAVVAFKWGFPKGSSGRDRTGQDGAGQ